jgi:hypothetical protein
MWSSEKNTTNKRLMLLAGAHPKTPVFGRPRSAFSDQLSAKNM